LGKQGQEEGFSDSVLCENKVHPFLSVLHVALSQRLSQGGDIANLAFSESQVQGSNADIISTTHSHTGMVRFRWNNRGSRITTPRASTAQASSNKRPLAHRHLEGFSRKLKEEVHQLLSVRRMGQGLRRLFLMDGLP